MGNCMETCAEKQQAVEMQQEGCERERTSPFEQGNGFEKGGIRIKIVLTKQELEWFMLQLKDKEGKSLEDVFREIERQRRRAKGEGWKPSLESITESPEMLEMER